MRLPVFIASVAAMLSASAAWAGWKDDLATGRDAIRQGHYDQAEAPLQSAVKEAAPDSLDSAEAINELGKLYRLTAQYDQADALDHQALAIRAKLRGENDPLLAVTLENLGELDTIRGKYALAQAELKQALAIRTAALGEASADTAESLSNLGFVDLCLCDYATGAALCQRAVDIQAKALGDDDPARAMGWDNLANARYIQGRLVEAESLFTRALNLRTGVLGEDHPDVGASYDNLGWLYMAWGDTTASRRFFKLAQFTRENSIGQRHPDTMESLAMLAEEEDSDKVAPQTTAPMMEQALAVEMKSLGGGHWVTQTVQANLAGVYIEMNRNAEAEKLLLAAQAEARQSFGDDNPNTSNVECSLADYYAGPGDNPAEAERLYKKSLATMDKFFGSGDRNTGFVLDRYAQFLKSQHRDAEAEPLETRAQTIQDEDEKRNPLSKLEGPGL